MGRERSAASKLMYLTHILGNEGRVASVRPRVLCQSPHHPKENKKTPLRVWNGTERGAARRKPIRSNELQPGMIVAYCVQQMMCQRLAWNYI